MKYPVLLIVILFVPYAIYAQHCPFDGGNMITVHIVDKRGNPLKEVSENPVLREIDNPEPEECAYAAGILEKPFLPPKPLLQSRYADYWERWIEPEYPKWGFYQAGFYAVVLNQAENTCMVKKDDDFTYRRRNFEIVYRSGKRNAVVKVPRDRIYSLCTGNGPWTRMIAIEIVVEDSAAD